MAIDAPRAVTAWRGWKPGSATLMAAALLVFGAALRFEQARHGIETPLIDENEVVEQAVAFLGGDLRHHFPKYGPLTMYALAGLYRVAAFLHGESALQYASRVFLEGSELYLIARLYVVGWLSVLAAAAFFGLRRPIGSGPALLVCSLLALPVLEVLSPGARIDVPQAAFQGLALLCLYPVVEAPRRFGMWALAGVCAGLGIATKPLPGLLVLPSLALAAWLSVHERGLARRSAAALRAPGPWLAAIACVACALLGNPAMLDLGGFLASQLEAMRLHSTNGLSATATSTVASLLQLGWPYVVLLLLALLSAGASLGPGQDRRALLPASFCLVYLAAFQGREVRAYFLVAAGVAGCLLAGHALASAVELASRYGSRPPLLRRLSALAWLPVAAACVWPVASTRWLRSVGPSASWQAQRWVEEHVPSGSKVFYIGWRASGPRLVATDISLQAKWGDHFEYGRERYAFLVEAFVLGFASYARSGKPRYDLSVYDALPRSHASRLTPSWVTEGLLRHARARQIRYVIVTGYGSDWRELGYPWFAQAKLLREFPGTVIFEVPAASAAVAAGGQAVPLAPADHVAAAVR